MSTENFDLDNYPGFWGKAVNKGTQKPADTPATFRVFGDSNSYTFEAEYGHEQRPSSYSCSSS